MNAVADDAPSSILKNSSWDGYASEARDGEADEAVKSGEPHGEHIHVGEGYRRIAHLASIEGYVFQQSIAG